MKKVFSFKNKLVLITGAGSGIGQALTLALLKKGAKVAAVDINESGLEELKSLANDQDTLFTYTLDITDKEAVEGLPKKVIANQGKIDVLINNAGIIQPFVKVKDLNYDSIDKVMNVNFYGSLYLIKTFLPMLLEKPEAYIANVSSMGGFLPVPGQSIYGASKAAVKLLTEALSAELSDTGVNVSVIFPGATKTNITENSGLKVDTMSRTAKEKKFKMTSAEDAAKVIILGMEKRKFQIFVGGDSKMMNILYRLSPGFAVRLIAKQMKSLLTK